MIKRNHPGRIILAGLIIIFGCTLLLNISAANTIEIKPETITIKDKEIGRIEHWYLPKTSDNIPWFYKTLQKIADFGGWVINFQDINKLPFGKSVAFLVGVSKYKYVKPQNLSFVENDLKDLANTLLTDCGFDDVYIAKNEKVSPELIKAVLLNKLNKELNPNDRLLFYYSGHGADLGGNTGYMQFFDCGTDRTEIDYSKDVLGIDECKEWSNLLKVKHILFVFDCCVSGWWEGLTRKGGIDSKQPTSLSMSGNGSRTIITAGTGKETSYGGAKYSLFTKAFINTIKKVDLYQNNNGFLTIGEIFEQVQRIVISQSDSKQHPDTWELDDNYSGNFVFINTNLQNVTLTPNDLPFLNINPKVTPKGVVVDKVGIIKLTSYLTGRVYIDDQDFGNINKGIVMEYRDISIGTHTIKVVNGKTIVTGTVNVVIGEITTLSITMQAEVFVQRGHSVAVISVAFSPDGKWALSGSWDKTLKLWEVSSGKEIRSFTGHSDSIHSVVFSPDGKYALSGSWDSSLKLWDISSGNEIRSFMGHSGSVYSVAFSPDGKYALLGSADEVFKLWDISSGKEIRSFMGHSDFVNSVAFSPNGKYALSGSRDKTLKLWEVGSGEEIRSFTGHSDSVNSVAFSPDGKLALSGSRDKTLKLWEVSSGKEIRSFTGHSDSVNSVVFSPGGKFALSGSRDKTLKLWEVSSGKEIRSFKGHSDRVNSVAFSPDGKYVLSGSDDTTIRIWNTAANREIAQFVSFDDGEWVVLTPEGYYNASSKGTQYLIVRIDNDIYSMEDYVKTYYRPDLVQAALRGEI